MAEEGGGTQAQWWNGEDPVSWLGPPHDPDRYKVLETASAGAEGRVLRGELLLDGNPIPVAIKVLHENQEDLGEWERRWNRQTEILRTVQHRSLVTVREAFVGARTHPFGADGGIAEVLYLVMNWASGQTLDEWATGRSVGEVLEVLGCLADAIDYLHRGEGSNGIGVIHRDIKPANVIVDHGIPILVDFGFARFTRSTDETVVVYSRSFAAPEVMRGETPDTSADRFAFAASALRVLTGLTAADCSRTEISEALQHRGLPMNMTEHLLALLDSDPAKRPVDLKPWYTSASQARQPGPSPTPVLYPAHAVPVSEQPVGSGTLMRAPSATRGVPDPPRAADEASRSNAGTVVTALAFAVVVLAVLGLGVWLWARSAAQSEVVIPDVVGVTKDQAIDMIEGVPVTASIEPVESSADAGIVVSVSPEEGSVIEPGAEVIIKYASGSYAMPDVTGRPVADAVQEIVSRGTAEEDIKLRPVAAEDSSTWCLVQSQMPAPEQRVDRASEVAVVVGVAADKSVESCTHGG